jgi:hypothetical protein
MSETSAAADDVERLDMAEHLEILERLDRIEASVARIAQQLGCMEASCSNMDDHITFVESVIARLRNPLGLLLGRPAQYLRG